MNNGLKSVIALWVFLFGLVFLVFGGNCFAKEKYGLNERLVALDIVGGGSYYEPKWCGSKALLIKGGLSGTRLINIITGKKTMIHNDSEDMPSHCTPDGEWMPYLKHVQIPSTEGDGSEYVNVEDLYLLEVATGQSKKVARVKGTLSYFADLYSPDGTMLLVSSEYIPEIKSQNIGFELVWFSKDYWRAGNRVLWLPDSSGIVTLLSSPDGIGVEFFGKDARAQRFDLDKAVAYNSGELRIDRQGRIYFMTANDPYPLYDDGPICPRDTSPDLEEIYQDPENTFQHPRDISYFINRCVIDGTELNCENVFERADMGNYDILPDGDIVFNAVDDKCIMRVSPEEDNARCFLRPKFGDGDINYREIRKIGVSPDGRWFAYLRTELSGGIRKNDLFVVDLNEINKED